MTAFSVYQLGVTAGTAAGLAIGGVVAEHSFLVLFVADAVTSAIWGVIAIITLTDTRTDRPSPAAADRPARRTVLVDRRLLQVVAVTILVNVLLFQAQTTLPLWVHRQGLSSAVYGLLLAVNSGLIMLLQIPSTRAIARYQPQTVIAVTSIVVGAGFGLLAVAHTPAVLVVAVAVWSLGELVQWPVAASYTTGLAPQGLVGRYAGTRSFAYGAGLLLAPLAGVAIYNIDPAVLWIGCAITGVVAAAAMTPRPAAPRRVDADDESCAPPRSARMW